MTIRQRVHIHPLLTGYANGIEEDWKEREAYLGSLVGKKRAFRTRSGYGVCGRKTPPLLPPSIFFLGSPMHRPTSPNLRRKGTGKGKEKAVEGDGDVEMLDGDEGVFSSPLCYYVFPRHFSI
jgi:hypothetical protein